ncbi:MarR family winged helix-turn-helix transcriptional regulator [Ramlibacter sp. AN1133]|uniref:MarR family winged helix-turn-helix transcriptional regulator n=1 Tax=Ramlibacter sp. AN1133 TaxID=3133429 RepID=UPI0030BB2F19
MARPTTSIPRTAAAAPAVEEIDTSFLESLVGYNARRAALAAIDRFLQGMAPYQLKPVDFSVLSLIHHNPGITSRQLCATLGILPPNLVGMLNALEKRELLSRMPHPRDGRAMGLHLTPGGQKLMRDAERTAAGLEAEIGARLSPAELQTLLRLLKKVYKAD